MASFLRRMMSVTQQTPSRRFPRVRLGYRDGLKTEVWQGSARRQAGMITVLGAGGALLEVSELFESGSTLGLCFTLPQSHTKIVCGAVVRSQILGPAGVGLEFVLLRPDDRHLLSEAVRTWPVVDAGS